MNSVDFSVFVSFTVSQSVELAKIRLNRRLLKQLERKELLIYNPLFSVIKQTVGLVFLYPCGIGPDKLFLLS